MRDTTPCLFPAHPARVAAESASGGFVPRELPPALRRGAGDTERAAARRVSPQTASQRSRVLAVIAEAGTEGLTDDEGETATGLRPQSYTPRRGELAKSNVIADSGRRRPTGSGALAIVWVTIEHAEGAGGGGRSG
mgnify:CR=1 FL=1